MAEITREWLEAELAAYAQKHTSAPCLRCRVEQKARTTSYPAMLQWAREALDVMDDLKASRDMALDRANNHLGDLSDLQERLEETQERERRLRGTVVKALAWALAYLERSGSYGRLLVLLPDTPDGIAHAQAKALLEELKEVPMKDGDRSHHA